MKELIIGTERQEDLLNLSTYRSVTYVQNLIKSKIISKDEIMGIIYNSGLFKKMKNQDTRLTQFWGNPEFSKEHQRTYSHGNIIPKITRNISIINTIYNAVTWSISLRGRI